MTELNEVFEMTTKQMEPDQDSWAQQQRRQGRAVRTRKLGAFAVAAAIGIVAVALYLWTRPGENASTPAGLPSVAGTFSRVVGGVPFTFDVPARGWADGPIVRVPDGSGFRSGDFLLSKSIVGPQGAEAVIYWTSMSDRDSLEPCGQWWGSPVASVADWAASASGMRGTELVTGPSAVAVGGYPAQQVVLEVRKDLGCDPGVFYTWGRQCWGPCWTETNLGDTIRLWIIDVHGTRLFFAAETTPQADAGLEKEIRQIVGSIRFG